MRSDAMRKRVLHKQPRATTRANSFKIKNAERGINVSVDMLISHRGNCIGATLANPHNAGEQPKTCDNCYAVT